MASHDKDQYGRKTWDIDEYARKATQKKGKVDPEAVAAHQLANDKSSSHTVQRQKLLDSSINAINKHTLISSDATEKNRRFGFTCPVCLLSYKDNMALIDHFNSPQHIQKVTSKVIKETDDDEEEEEILEAGIRRASPEEVEKTLDVLLQKLLDSTEHKQSMQQRIEARKRMEEKMQEKKRQKRKRKKQSKSKDAEYENGSDTAEEMAKTMGFASFGSTKK